MRHNAARCLAAPLEIENGVTAYIELLEAERAEMLFTIEAVLPFVRDAVGERSCSSAGGPTALDELLRLHDWIGSVGGGCSCRAHSATVKWSGCSRMKTRSA